MGKIFRCRWHVYEKGRSFREGIDAKRETLLEKAATRN
jgi:hypothetical protein